MSTGIDDILTVETNEEAEQGMNKVTQKIKSRKQELTELKSEADKAEKQKQSLVDESRVALVSILIFVYHECSQKRNWLMLVAFPICL